MHPLVYNGLKQDCCRLGSSCVWCSQGRRKGDLIINVVGKTASYFRSYELSVAKLLKKKEIVPPLLPPSRHPPDPKCRGFKWVQVIKIRSKAAACYRFQEQTCELRTDLCADCHTSSMSNLYNNILRSRIPCGNDIQHTDPGSPTCRLPCASSFSVRSASAVPTHQVAIRML